MLAGGIMKVVSVLNPKGGSGKTTLATNLACGIHERGLRVLLVDSDIQGSARDWHAARDDNPIPLVALDRAPNLRSVSSVGQGYDLIVVDGAANLDSIIPAAIRISSAVVIPVQPSPYDIWAAGDLVDLIKARQEVTDGIPRCAFVISRAIKNTKLGSEVTDALGEYGLPVFRSRTCQRQLYAQSVSEGLSVLAHAKSEAASEIQAITAELLEEYLSI
jgi:chromosome partitioning protein